MRKIEDQSNKSLKDPNFDQKKISKIPLSIFVTRIPGSIDNDAFYSLFSVFGEIRECYIATRKNGKKAGYGYVIAGNQSTFDAIISSVHHIAGRQLILLPFKDETVIQNETNHYSKRKICISKVPHALSPDLLISYFQKIGNLENFFEVKPPLNQLKKRNETTHETRKYSYIVVFEDIQSVKYLERFGNYLNINGYKIHLKIFIDKNKLSSEPLSQISRNSKNALKNEKNDFKIEKKCNNLNSSFYEKSQISQQKTKIINKIPYNQPSNYPTSQTYLDLDTNLQPYKHMQPTNTYNNITNPKKLQKTNLIQSKNTWHQQRQAYFDIVPQGKRDVYLENKESFNTGSQIYCLEANHFLIGSSQYKSNDSTRRNIDTYYERSFHNMNQVLNYDQPYTKIKVLKKSFYGDWFFNHKSLNIRFNQIQLHRNL